jgi:hypothetical protein
MDVKMTSLFPSNVLFLPLRMFIAKLERDIADARCDLGADIVAIDMGIAEHGRRLAEEMGDKSCT